MNLKLAKRLRKSAQSITLGKNIPSKYEIRRIGHSGPRNRFPQVVLALNCTRAAYHALKTQAKKANYGTN